MNVTSGKSSVADEEIAEVIVASGGEGGRESEMRLRLRVSVVYRMAVSPSPVSEACTVRTLALPTVFAGPWRVIS